jgi:hypothetical protein
MDYRIAYDETFTAVYPKKHATSDHLGTLCGLKVRCSWERTQHWRVPEVPNCRHHVVKCHPFLACV